MKIEIKLENKKLLLQKNTHKFYTENGIVLSGGNADGKTKELEKLSRILENSKYIKVSEISKIYDEEINSAGNEINLNEGAKFSGFYEYINQKAKILLKLISEEFFDDENIFISDNYLEFRYSNNETKITSHGQDNLIKLSIFSSYQIFLGKKILLLDEPNSNLDDKNSSKVIQGIMNILKNENSEIFIIASTNNSNIIEELENSLIYNIKSKEICYSNDLLGNKDAIERITSNYISQKTLISKNREVLTKIYLGEIQDAWRYSDRIVYPSTEDSYYNYSVIYISNFSKLEEKMLEMIRWSYNNNTQDFEFSFCGKNAKKKINWGKV